MRSKTIPCLECGKQVRVIHANHLRGKDCTGLSKEQYIAKHPNTPLTSQAAWEAKSKASRRLMASGYRDTLTKRMVEMNRSPERREAVSQGTKARWSSGEQREAVEGWHRDNREASLSGAANARSHVTDTSMAKARAAMNKTSKMHLRFKDRMVNAGITGFTTEGKVGPFDVDEVHAELRLAVEIDGCYWHGCSDCGHIGVPSTLANDKRKDAYLKAAGWTLLRIPGHMVRSNPDAALDLIASTVEQARRSAA